MPGVFDLIVGAMRRHKDVATMQAWACMALAHVAIHGTCVLMWRCCVRNIV